eukprot:jgi/Orpsp1_1/1188862/evm.model.d7180000067752.1
MMMIIIDFAGKVISSKINDEEIDEILNEIKEKDYYTAREAIYMIKNIELTMYYIRFERTDYQTPSNEAQLYLAKFINSKGSLNYNIMIVSLFLTQIQILKDKNGKLYYSFHKIMRSELIEMLFGRLESLVKKDKLLAADWKNEFNNLMKTDKRFSHL